MYAIYNELENSSSVRGAENSKFLAYYFQTEAFHNQKRKLATGTKVIDVKGDYGELTFPMSESINKYTKSANKNPIIKEIEPVIKKLKDNGIYTIARIVSFKDIIYAKENPDKIIVCELLTTNTLRVLESRAS